MTGWEGTEMVGCRMKMMMMMMMMMAIANSIIALVKVRLK
jgi:hypothetical protein